jgi:hypothetical protein
VEVLKIIYYGLLTISLVTLFFNIEKLPGYCKWFLPLIGLGLLVQVASEIMEALDIRSYFLFHSYQPIECLLLLSFYRQVLSFRTKLLPVFLFVLYILILVVHYLRFPASFNTWDFFDFAAEAFIVCIFVIIFFLQLLKKQERTDFKRFTALWLNAVHLIFYGGCLFVMGLYYYMKLNDPALARRVLSINHFLNLFLYVAYTLIFACTATQKKYYLL